MGRFKLFYLLIYISFSTHHFLNLYFRNIGLSGVQIGTIKALSAVVLIFSQPIWGWLCDLLQLRKGLLSLILFFSATTFLLIPLKLSFFWIFLIIAIYGLFKSPIIPIIDSIVMIEINGDGNKYSQIRLWGGLGLTISVVLMGYYFNQSSLDQLFVIYAMFTLVSLVVAIFLPTQKGCFVKRKFQYRDFLRLLQYREFIILILAILFLQTGAFIIDGFFGLYVQERIGNEVTLGWALTIAGFSEVLVYYFLGKNQHIAWPRRLLLISALTSALRWFLYARSNLVVQILLLQLFHGLTFGFFYIAAVTYVDRLIPREFATSGQTTLWAIAFGIASVLGSILGGYLYDQWNYQILFWVASILAIIAFILFLSLKDFNISRGQSLT